MGDLASRIMEELTCKTAFTIPVFGGIPIAESVAVSWIIMGVLVVLSIVLTRHLRVTGTHQKTGGNGSHRTGAYF